VAFWAQHGDDGVAGQQVQQSPDGDRCQKQDRDELGDPDQQVLAHQPSTPIPLIGRLARASAADT
jgi:hypothetical protein